MLYFISFSKLQPQIIDSKHTQDYTNIFPVCKGVIILQVTVNKIEVLSHFGSISSDFLASSAEKS